MTPNRSVTRRLLSILLLLAIALAACQPQSAAPAPKAEPVAKTDAAKPTSAPAAKADTKPADASKPATQADAQPTATGKPETKPAASAMQKDNLVVAIAGEPTNLDTTNDLGNVGVRLLYPIFDLLIRRDFLDGNKLVPSLATSWRRVDDLTLELKLRDGVLFHDGSKLTADDVKFTFDRILDPNARGEARGYFLNLEGVQVVDPLTVRIATKAPDPLLEQRLASYGAWIVPKVHVEKVGNEAFIQAPVGTGPYKFVEWRRESQLVLDRFDGYWDQAPAAKRITFRLIPETATRVAALLSGEVDIITNLPPDQVETVEANAGTSVRSVPLANAHVLRYNVNSPALKDVRVRRAMNLAIDREGLVRALWRGKATVPRGFTFEGEFGYDPSRPTPEFNPDKARALLQEAGYAGEPIVYRTSPTYYSNGRQAAEAIVEMWKKVGLTVQLEVIEQAANTQIDESGGLSVSNWSATSTLGDPDGYLWRNWGPDNNHQKRGYWQPEEFNQLGREARTILDQTRRNQIYQRMFDIFEQDAPGTVLYIPLESYGLRKGIDWTPYPIYYFDARAYNLKLTAP